ncbi:MAG: acriflavin resistance protein [Ruminococcaceae bacterium]|nr:acriflavin resistance protein [Oscillospiraceae bacterium]
MSKFSVKKPLTIFVAVIAVLVLGVVAYFKMTPDLLPNMDFPYVVVMTTYPGASPEKVEEELTKPMEQSMSTLEHIKEVSSNSAENVSVVILEFEESVNMDTIGVDIQQEIATLSANWADTVGTPYVLKINPSMLPVEVAALSMEGKDTIELTEFLNDTLMNKLEGIPGVARITTTGMVEQQLHVVLDQKLIDKANERIMDAINGELDDAAEELQEQKDEMESSKNQMDGAQSQLSAGADAMVQGQNQLREEKENLLAAKEEMEAAKAPLETAVETLTNLNEQVNTINSQKQMAEEGLAGLKALKAQGEAINAMAAGIAALEKNIAELEAAETPDAALIEAKKAELVQLQAQYAQGQAVYNATLAAAGMTPETLDAGIAQAESGLQAAEDALGQIDQALAAYNTDHNGLAALLAETKGQLDQLNAGLEQMESGLLSMEDAEAMLEQQKLSGILQLSTTAAKLVAGSSSLEMALTQIESGLETIEDSREGALREADLNNIITMDMVSQILTAQNFSMPAGYVEQDGISYMVSIGDEITELETLQDLLLFDMGMEGVDPIYLSDVAVVTLTDNAAETYAKLNGLDSVMLTFEKQSTYATAETTENINDRFRELEAEYPGLKFVSLMDQGDYIYMVVEAILSNLFLGALFSVLVLFLFLRDIRPTFITLCSIPISVVFAIVLMYFSGVTLNMISLSGLAIAVGMLVDNSIVVIENIYRLRDKGATAIQAAVSGAKQVVGAVTASTLTTVCVFVPIVFVDGITRQLFTDLALTMSYALLASLIVSLTLVPAMASGMLRKEHKPKNGILERIFLPAYKKAVRWSLGHKVIVLILAAALLVGSCLACLAQGFIFMPDMDSPNVTVTVTMPEHADMEETTALADEVLSRIEPIEGIETVGAMLGGGLSIGGMSTGGSGVTVYVTLEDETASGAVVAKQIEEACAGMDCTVTATSAMMDMSMLTGSGISMNLYADDMDTLQNAAREAAKVLGDMEGISEVSDGLEDVAPALHITIDRNEAMKHSLTVAQIYMELAAGLTADGNVATLYLDGITTDVIIEKPEGAVLDGSELRDYVFEVKDREGEITEAPLSDFAEVEETTSLSTINRIGQRRYLTVSAQLEEGYNVTLLTEQAETAMKNAELGDGVSYAFTGENEMIMEAMEQLMLMLLLGILLVYLIMVAQFQSLKSPFIVMFTIPLAFTGGFLALLLCGMELSVISMIGFVMLVGIIVNNGIVLVDYINQLRLEGVDRREAIVEAGVTRMRPILMTTLTTILGQLVMALSGDMGAVMMRPIVVVSIGGLLYATLMTLFVVPCIYDMLNKKDLRKISEEDLEILNI